MNSPDDLTPKAGMSDEQVDEAMRMFRAGLAHMDSDPGEAARIRALVHQADVADALAQPRGKVLAKPSATPLLTEEPIRQDRTTSLRLLSGHFLGAVTPVLAPARISGAAGRSRARALLHARLGPGR